MWASPTNSSLKEPLQLFNYDFDPYDRIMELERLLTQVAENQEAMANQLSKNAWMIEEISNGCSRIAQTMTNLHYRLQKLEEQNEKD